MGDKLKWDEMSARERDALIAQKVMGLTVYEDFPVNAVHTWDTPTSFRVFRPATDIAAAWEVVMEMRSDVWDMVFEIDEHMWRCSFKRTFHSQIGKAVEKTAPEAICLAALRAVGVDIRTETKHRSGLLNRWL